DRGQDTFLIREVGARIVRAFDVRPQVAGEVDRFAAYLERASSSFDGDRDASAAGIFHLAGDGSLPDHVENFRLVRVERTLDGRRQLEGMACRTNGFVGFLGV